MSSNLIDTLAWMYVNLLCCDGLSGVNHGECVHTLSEYTLKTTLITSPFLCMQTGAVHICPSVFAPLAPRSVGRVRTSSPIETRDCCSNVWWHFFFFSNLCEVFNQPHLPLSPCHARALQPRRSSSHTNITTQQSEPSSQGNRTRRRRRNHRQTPPSSHTQTAVQQILNPANLLRRLLPSS